MIPLLTMLLKKIKEIIEEKEMVRYESPEDRVVEREREMCEVIDGRDGRESLHMGEDALDIPPSFGYFGFFFPFPFLDDSFYSFEKASFLRIFQEISTFSFPFCFLYQLLNQQG